MKHTSYTPSRDYLLDGFYLGTNKIDYVYFYARGLTKVETELYYKHMGLYFFSVDYCVYEVYE